MEVETKDESTPVDEEGSQDKGDRTTWYPYITKTQFEKFLSRLQNKIPEEINRDYVRAIIRTPSMIYRFLRGIEAMKLIDREQHPTDRLQSLVAPETRRQTLGEIVKDLYPGLLQEWDEADGKMSDRDIVSFFRKETGMGNDSANKMKMFFKYLQSEAVAEGQPEAGAGEDEAPKADEPKAEEAQADEPKAEEPQAEPAEPAVALRQPVRQGPRQQGSRGGRDSRRDNQSDRGGRDSSRQDTQSDRGGRDSSRQDSSRQDSSADRGGRDSSRQDSQADRAGQVDRSYNSRVLSEAQRAYLDTLKSVLKVNIDGDWDDDMIRLAFDRLERLFDRVRRG